MNKTTNIAFELAQDIYNLSGDVDTLFEKYGNHQISAQVFYKKLYVHACEANFLEGVVKSLKSEGYKFQRYGKEIQLLNTTIDEISDSLQIVNVNSLENSDIKHLAILTDKYKDLVSVEEISEEF